MGVKLNIFNVVLVILFVIGIIISAFLLFNLPNNLLRETAVLDIEEIPALLPVLTKVNIAVGATLFVGLTVIVMFLFSSRGNENFQINSGSAEKRSTKSATEEREATEAMESDIETREYEVLFTAKNSPEELSDNVLTMLCKELEASQGAVYFAKKTKEQRLLELKGSYAYVLPDSETITFEFGEGLVGQAAKTGKVTHITDVPEGYIEIFSGLGHSKPGELLLIPVKNDKEVLAVAEIATFKPFSKREIRLAEKVFNMFSAHLAKTKTAKTTEKEDKN